MSIVELLVVEHRLFIIFNFCTISFYVFVRNFEIKIVYYSLLLLSYNLKEWFFSFKIALRRHLPLTIEIKARQSLSSTVPKSDQRCRRLMRTDIV